MKKLLIPIVKAISISLCITALVMPQALQQYTKTIVNGEDKWTLNKQYHSIFAEEEPQQLKIDPQNLFHQKHNASHTNFFDDRWTLQLPYPTDAYLIATEADNDFIISAGFNGLFSTVYGEIITSTDKGETWNINRSGNDTIFYTMDMEGNSIWVGGIEFDIESEIYNSYLIKSTDLGKSWNEKLSIDSFAVLYLNFFDENNGVAIGEKELSDSFSVKIFHTSDGGDSWSANVNIFQSGFQGPQSYHFSSPEYGWKCIKDPYPSDIGRIINTTDGGETWNLQMADTLESLNFIKFFNSNYGWTIGEKHSGTSHMLLLYSTTDGGNNWNNQTLFAGEEYNFFGYDMFVRDSLNGWLAVANYSDLTIYKTNDGFISMNELSVINEIDFWFGDIEFISETEGWITSGLGMIHHTSDGGYSWEPKHRSVTTKNLNSLDFINEKTGWAASRGYYGQESIIIKSVNGGVDWDIINSDSAIWYVDMDFVSEQTGFVVTDNYLANTYAINKTEDGGFSWDSTLFDNTKLNSILFTDTDNGWAVGENNLELFITHTSNSGDSWYQQTDINLIGGPNLNNADFSNSLNGFAVGDFGIVLKTTNGGSTWRLAWGNLDPNLFWINYDLTGVYVPDPSTCWISGITYQSGEYRTMVAHTVNGGANWDTTSFSSGSSSGDIFFINESDGYIVGIRSDYKTIDGGATWSQIDYPSDINSMFFLNEGLGWAVGSNGRIFNFYDPTVGIEELTDANAPDNYLLMQNYPNPFNPSTTIKFSLPYSGYASLTIYNALGEEMEVLLDNEFTAGTYEVQWNATALPSGVYFYQLKIYPANGGAEGFVQTKKMLLLK